MAGNFVKNTLITFFVRVATIAFGIGTTVIIARAFGPKDQGIYSLATLVPGIILIFANFGIGTASVFYVGKKKYSPKTALLGNIIFTVLISAAALFIGIPVLLFFGAQLFPGIRMDYLILAMSLLPFYIFFDLISGILLGLQKISKYNLVLFLQPFFFIVLILIFLSGMRFGVGAAILAQTLSFAAAGAVLFFMVAKEAQKYGFDLSKRYFKDSISYGTKSCLAGIFNFLHYRADIFLINFFMNPAAAGIYYVATRIAEGIWLVSTSAGTVLLPRVAQESDEKKLKDFTPLVCRNVFFITAILAIAALLLSRWIVALLYSDEFIDSVYPLQILLVGSLFISGWRILANDIAARGKPMINTYAIGLSFLLNIALNIFLIPKYGIAGAAYATAFSYFFVFAITVLAYAKISGNKIRKIILLEAGDVLVYKEIVLSFKRIKKIV